MNKKDVVAHIQEYLTEELKTAEAAAKAALEAARHEENKPENEYDTRAVEAGYLAGAQAKRLEELRAQLHMFRFLPVREYGAGDVACPGALVELEHNKRRSFYYIVPQGGGLVMSIEGNPIQVITPMSPIGEALMGRKQGEIVEVEARNEVREYKVISVR